MSAPLSDLQKEYLHNRYFVQYVAVFKAVNGIDLHIEAHLTYPERDRRAEASLIKRGLLRQEVRKVGFSRLEVEELTAEGVSLAAELFSVGLFEKCNQAWADAMTLAYLLDYADDFLGNCGFTVRNVRSGVVYARAYFSGVGEVYFNTASRTSGMDWVTTSHYQDRLTEFDGEFVRHLGKVLENVEWMQGILQELRS